MSPPSLPGTPGVTVAGAKVGRHPIHARHSAATAASAATKAQLQLTGEDQFAHRLWAPVAMAPMAVRPTRWFYTMVRPSMRIGNGQFGWNYGSIPKCRSIDCLATSIGIWSPEFPPIRSLWNPHVWSILWTPYPSLSHFTCSKRGHVSMIFTHAAMLLCGFHWIMRYWWTQSRIDPLVSA